MDEGPKTSAPRRDRQPGAMGTRRKETSGQDQVVFGGGIGGAPYHVFFIAYVCMDRGYLCYCCT